MSTEKIIDPRKLHHWPGHMETDYIYTLGIAGEKFFKEIKENGRIFGGRCQQCDITFVPPRMYCERCFAKITEWKNVGTKGAVFTFSVAYIDVNGAKLKNPVIYALIKFNGAEGGLVHKLGEVEHQEVFIGMSVEALFKPQTERTGNINDIKYFRPSK